MDNYHEKLRQAGRVQCFKSARNAQNQLMEDDIKPIEELIASLQKDAQKRKIAVVVEARIAIAPERLRLLEVQPVAPLAVIHY